MLGYILGCIDFGLHIYCVCFYENWYRRVWLSHEEERQDWCALVGVVRRIALRVLSSKTAWQC